MDKRGYSKARASAFARLGVGLDGRTAVVSLDGVVLRSLPYPFTVTSLELVGRGLSVGAGPACVDDVRVVAAAAASTAPSVASGS